MALVVETNRLAHAKEDGTERESQPDLKLSISIEMMARTSSRDTLLNGITLKMQRY